MRKLLLILALVVGLIGAIGMVADFLIEAVMLDRVPSQIFDGFGYLLFGAIFLSYFAGQK